MKNPIKMLGPLKKCRKCRWAVHISNFVWIRTASGNAILKCSFCMTAHERTKEEKKKEAEIARKNLEESFIIKTIIKKTKLRPEDIPQEMIDFQRSVLLLERDVKRFSSMSCPTHGNLTIRDMIKSGIKRGKQQYKCRKCGSKQKKNHYINNKDRVLSKCRMYKQKIRESKYQIGESL